MSQALTCCNCIACARGEVPWPAGCSIGGAPLPANAPLCRPGPLAMGGCWDMPLGAQHTGTLLWQAALACAPWPATPEEPVAGCMTVLAGRAKEVPRESDPTLGGQPCPTIKEHLTNEIGRWSCQDLVLPGPHHQRWVTAKRGYGPGRTIWSWQDQVLVPLTVAKLTSAQPPDLLVHPLIKGIPAVT